MRSPTQFTHTIAFLLLLARAGDIGSTYLVTPKLRLEANALVRRWRWPFAFATLALAAVPYYSLSIGVMLLVGSLLVCSSNLSGLWIVRAMGEEAYYEHLVANAGRSSWLFAAISIFGSAGCMAAVGIFLVRMYSDEDRNWGYVGATGIVVFSIVIAFWRSVAYLRLRKLAMTRRAGAMVETG